MRWIKRKRNRDGTVRVYVEPPRRQRVRLPDLPYDHPDFLAAYAEATRQAAPARQSPIAGTLEAVADAYRRGLRWRALKGSSQEQRGRELHRLVQKAGHLHVAAIKAKHIRADIAALTPGAASNRLRAWRALMAQAMDMGLIEHDPARDVQRVTFRSSGHRQWMQDDVDAFRARWPVGTEQRLAMELGLWTGARVSDLVRLGWQHVGRDGWLTYTQQKTGGEVSVPFIALPAHYEPTLHAEHRYLMAALEIARDRMLFLVTAHGAARSQKAVSAWVRSAADKAGLPSGSTPHGWRKACAAMRYELGWSTGQIGAWTGHRSLKEIEAYTRDASRRRLLEGPDREQKSGRGPTTDRDAGEKTG